MTCQDLVPCQDFFHPLNLVCVSLSVLHNKETKQQT